MLLVRDFLADQIILRDEKSTTPTVSVVLPTHRRRDSLRRAIESVLAQTFRDFELIVMDDGSSDGSYDLIEDLRARDSRLVHVRHARNCGLPGLRVNEGIELARGQFLAFQFDDDCWRPNALESLVNSAKRQSKLAVCVGHACFHGATREWQLPAMPLNVVNLYSQNLFANNSVLVPRQLVDQFGMYDCHIGMRRLCDWDLWLRYIKSAPFVVIDEIVSDVYESRPGSIGLTVPWDLALFRFFHDIPRNSLLTPERWRDYPVDTLRVAETDFPGDLRRRLYEQHIVPYYFRFRHHFPQLEGFAATVSPVAPKSVLLTKNSYDVSNDITQAHYDSATHQRGNYKAHFEPLSQVAPDWRASTDGLLLMRTVEESARALVQQALQSDTPVGLYLDDDLLHFAELGAQFNYLAPGTPYHETLSDVIRSVDAVWTTNRFIEESVRSLNARVVPHNNCIPNAWLPPGIRARALNKPWRIGYVGSNYRIEEFRHIWDALLCLSRERGDQLCFEFWGLDISTLPPLASPVVVKPFTFSYFDYLRQLGSAEFDLLLAPLLEQPRPRLAKSLIKYYEFAAAGALGIFSDVPPYAILPAGLTCLKTANTAEGWYATIQHALTMPSAEFDLMRRRALEHTREEFTETAQIHLHEAAWRATEFHARTRAQRHADGKPRVLYVLHSANFGGGELQLWRRLRLARNYGIEPIVVLPRILENSDAAIRIRETLTREHIHIEFVDYTCFTEPRAPTDFFSEPEREQVRALIARCAPVLVHTVTFIPTFGQICAEMNLPHTASLYAVEDDFAWANGAPDFRHSQIVQSDSFRYAVRWSELLRAEKFCARELVPESIFNLGQKRYLTALGAPPPPARPRVRMVVTGTLQERKNQLETIQAIGQLTREGFDCQLDLYGYTHFFPEYVNRCRASIETFAIQDRVRFRGFCDDVGSILADADCVLSLSGYESFPSAIKEAMAAGVLVVATPVGGIAELIIDGVSGILCADTSVEAMTDGIRRALKLTAEDRARIVEQARRVARSEFHPYRAANDLLTMYNRALDLGRARQVITPAPNLQPAIAPQRSRMLAPVAPPASVVPLDRCLLYRVVPQQSQWIGLDVLIGTHQRPARGTLHLRVYSPSAQLVRECSVDLAHAQDNEWLHFRFAPILNFTERTARLEFVLRDPTATTRLSFYDANPPANKLWRIRARLARWLGLSQPMCSLYCRMWYAQ